MFKCECNELSKMQSVMLVVDSIGSYASAAHEYLRNKIKNRALICLTTKIDKAQFGHFSCVLLLKENYKISVLWPLPEEKDKKNGKKKGENRGRQKRDKRRKR